jgi:hypothetical protein
LGGKTLGHFADYRPLLWAALVVALCSCATQRGMEPVLAVGNYAEMDEPELSYAETRPGDENTGTSVEDSGTDTAGPHTFQNGHRDSGRPAAPRNPPGATPPGNELCEISETYIPQRECEALRRQLDGMQDRDLDLFAESPMYRGQPAWARAVLRAVGAAPGSSTGRPTVHATTKVSATRQMAARLTGDGFEITPSGWVSQAVGLAREGEWRWRVRPLRDGPGELTVTIVPQLTRPNATPISVRRYTKSLQVQVRVLPGERSTQVATKINDQSRAWALALGGIALLIAAVTGIVIAVRKFLQAMRGKSTGEGVKAGDPPA